nr:hypothetical protein [Tanacetum cinerariifolium]
MARVSIMRILLVFAATAMLLDMAVAVDITVGSPNGGWDLSTDLSSWASSQTFSVGDNLAVILSVAEAHCSQGMKVQIDVRSGTSTPTTPSPAPPQTTPPSSTIPPANGPTTSSPPPPSFAITLKMTAGSVLGFVVLVMMLLSL